MDQKSASASKKNSKKKASVKKENTVKKTASKKEPAKKTSASSKGTVARKSAPAKKTVQTKTVAKNVPAKKDAQKHPVVTKKDTVVMAKQQPVQNVKPVVVKDSKEPKSDKKTNGKKIEDQKTVKKLVTTSEQNKPEQSQTSSEVIAEDDDVPLDPQVQKLLDYAKTRQIISWDEITEILTTEYVNSPKMEEVLQLLSQNNIQVMEEDTRLLDEEEDEEEEDDDDEVEPEESEVDATIDTKADDASKHRLVSNDKDSNIDDPIRLYLREIGKENLLTAEQEVILSKKMEDGQNIIKDVIKHSGMMIPEFFAVAQKAFMRIDLHEPGRARKEINEEMAEKRRLKSCYSEYLKPILPEMKQYMTLKKTLNESDQSMNIFKNEEIIDLRAKIQPELQKIDIQSEEIERFSDKFLDATAKIDDYHHKQEKRMKELRISDPAGLRSIGRRLATHSDSLKLEKELGMTADEIREVYTQIQKSIASLEGLNTNSRTTLMKFLI